MSASLDGLRVFVRTFGCQMNENDSEHISGILARAGAGRADRPEDADIVVVNTCAVREKSEEKVYSYLGRLSALKKRRPFLLGVAGCVAQMRGKVLRRKRPFRDERNAPQFRPFMANEPKRESEKRSQTAPAARCDPILFLSGCIISLWCTETTAPSLLCLEYCQY